MADEGTRAGTTSAARTGRKLPIPTSRRGNACVCSGSGGNVARSVIVRLAFLAHTRVSVSDGTMIIFSSCMVVLRAATEDLLAQRRVHIATFWCLSWTLFHHAPLPFAVCTLMIAMVGTAPLRPLMPTSGLPHLPAPSFPAAERRAVRVSAIASRTQEEDLSTLRKSADNEA